MPAVKTKEPGSKRERILSAFISAEGLTWRWTAAAKRFVPIIPSLPNGLKDAVLPDNLGPCDPRQQGQSSRAFSASRHRTNIRTVETLLNPCHCKDVWSCRCRAAPVNATSGPSSAAPPSFSKGLAALAQAAAMCCSTEASPLAATPTTLQRKGSTPQPKASKKRSRDGRRSPTPVASVTEPKRHKSHNSHCHNHSAHSRSPSVHYPERGPDLPPLLPPSHLALIDATSDAITPVSLPPPIFPSIPPLNAVASLAGTGCACGFQCACPGCVEHRGAQHASPEHTDCPDECGTCVDHLGGLELPLSSGTTRGAPSAPSAHGAPSILDKFFAQAAALPRPPVRRGLAGALDTTDVRVYPRDLFEPGPDAHDLARRTAFGLGVALPKLECCGGRCGCPGDSCACGNACDGCCAEHQAEGRAQEAGVCEREEVTKVVREAVQPRKSCCSA